MARPMKQLERFLPNDIREASEYYKKEALAQANRSRSLQAQSFIKYFAYYIDIQEDWDYDCVNAPVDMGTLRQNIRRVERMVYRFIQLKNGGKI